MHSQPRPETALDRPLSLIFGIAAGGFGGVLTVIATEYYAQPTGFTDITFLSPQLSPIGLIVQLFTTATGYMLATALMRRRHIRLGSFVLGAACAMTVLHLQDPKRQADIVIPYVQAAKNKYNKFVFEWRYPLPHKGDRLDKLPGFKKYTFK